MERSRYIPAFDGIRAVAVMLVFAYHTGLSASSGGFVGVDVFFVLSGYLITTILYREIKDTGALRFRRFYLRRFLRLTPPLVILIGCFLLAGGDRFSALRAALYLNDLLPPKIDSLNHTWSLAVEEHYYLVWPLVLLAILRFAPRRALPICVGLYALAWASRFAGLHFEGAAHIYERLDARLTGLMLGSAVALFVAEGHRIRGIGRWGILALVPMFGIIPFNSWDSGLGLSLGIGFTEAASALAIVSIAQAEETFSFLAALPLRYVGRISYGVYLYHCPLTLWMTDHGWAWWLIVIVALPLTLVLASLSYHLVERPLLSLSRPIEIKRFGPILPRPAARPPSS
jgi:peptidoglycan/LPS O-acetylase OafA/YrhL